MERLLKLVGAVAGLTALVTFAGGAVLWIRFSELDLPADQVVTLLPKQLLLTTGARELLGPVALGLLLTLLVVVAAPLRHRDGSKRRRVLYWAGLGLLLLALLVLVMAIAWDGTWVARAAMLIAALVGLGAILAAAILTRDDGYVPLAWTCVGAVLLIAVALVIVHESTSPRLEPVAVLLRGTPDSVVGFYIGQTADRLYVAPLPGTGGGDDPFADQPIDRVVELHRDAVTALVMREPVPTDGDAPGRDEGRTLLSDLRLMGVDPSTIPIDPVTTIDPVATFAPLVNLHVDEGAWPMSAGAFLQHAWLTWSAPGCPAWIQGSGDADGASGATRDHPELLGRFQVGRLAGVGAYARAPENESCGLGGGARIAADAHTRPWDKGNGRPALLPLREGWALDVRDDWRRPRATIEREGPQQTIRNVPAYFERHPDGDDERITYWFFYGLSHPPGVPAYTERASHEGDWERISVLLQHRPGSSAYLPLSVRFHTHDGHRDVPWRAIVRVAGGSSPALTHPVAYSAVGSHATYWRTGDYAIVVKLADHPALAVHDHAMACSGCPQWRTWERLVDATTQPWYGFGGAWGAAGSIEGGGTTGPLGPSRYKTAGANPAPDEDAGARNDADHADAADGALTRDAGPHRRDLRLLALRHRDLPLQDLARRALRQLGHEPHVTRVLVGRDALLDECLQVLRRRVRTRLQRDGGADLLAQLGVRHCHDRRLGDGRVLVEHLLDLAGIDVVAAADDQVLLAIDDEEVAVLVDLREVTGVEPAAAHRLGRRVGTLPVALHHVRALDDDLPHLALRDLLVVLVEDLHLDVADRRADRAGLALAVGVVEGCDRRGLAQPVPLQDLRAELSVERAQHLDRQRRAAGDADAQRGRVGPLPLRHREHRVVHRRHAEEDAHAVALHDRQRLGRVEARQQRQARAAHQARVHRRRLPEAVEQRQRTEDHVVRRSIWISVSSFVFALPCRFACVSSAPFGLPVVPDV